MKYFILVSLFVLGGCATVKKDCTSCKIKKPVTVQCKADACKIAKKCLDSCKMKKAKKCTDACKIKKSDCCKK